MVTFFLTIYLKNRIGTLQKQHLVAENSVNHMENFLSWYKQLGIK
jgi:hypothetical protein